MADEPGTDPDGQPHRHMTFPAGQTHLYEIIRENITQTLERLHVDVSTQPVDQALNDVTARIIRLIREAQEDAH